jgi:hypothetical protein
MKLRILGLLMVMIPVGCLIAGMVVVSGWRVALVSLGFSIVFTALVAGGVILMSWSK